MNDAPEQGTTVILYEVLCVSQLAPIRVSKCVYYKDASWREVCPHDTHPVPGKPFINEWAFYHLSGGTWHMVGRLEGSDGPDRVVDNRTYFRSYKDARDMALVRVKKQVEVSRSSLEQAERRLKGLEEAIEAPMLPGDTP